MKKAIGIDPGDARIGVAGSDDLGLLAHNHRGIIALWLLLLLLSGALLLFLLSLGLAHVLEQFLALGLVAI